MSKAVGCAREDWLSACILHQPFGDVPRSDRQGDRCAGGYRRIADLLRAAGTKIIDKRVYRLYKLANLSVSKRRGRVDTVFDSSGMSLP